MNYDDRIFHVYLIYFRNSKFLVANNIVLYTIGTHNIYVCTYLNEYL